MKRSLFATVIIALSLLANAAMAQDTTSVKKKKAKKTTVVISNRGIKLTPYDSSAKTRMISDKDSLAMEKHDEDKQFNSSFFMFDLGVNILQDNTNYTDPAVGSFLNVPANRQNKNLFDLRAAKSINVNIYPFMESFRILKTPGQKMYLSTGLGLQIYNFRYENPLTYTRNPATVTLSATTFKKDKLAVDYLNIPLMLTFKTRIHKDATGKSKNDTWLVYGAGLTEGIRLSSWTKQKSDQYRKVKVHDAYGLADFNTCVTAEIGVEGVIRFFASYQLTSLYRNALDQHPISIGFRISGI